MVLGGEMGVNVLLLVMMIVLFVAMAMLINTLPLLSQEKNVLFVSLLVFMGVFVTLSIY